MEQQNRIKGFFLIYTYKATDFGVAWKYFCEQKQPICQKCREWLCAVSGSRSQGPLPRYWKRGQGLPMRACLVHGRASCRPHKYRAICPWKHANLGCCPLALNLVILCSLYPNVILFTWIGFSPKTKYQCITIIKINREHFVINKVKQMLPCFM